MSPNGTQNLPAGERQARPLAKLAAAAGTSETHLARTILRHGIDQMTAGEMKYDGPTLG